MYRLELREKQFKTNRHQQVTESGRQRLGLGLLSNPVLPTSIQPTPPPQRSRTPQVPYPNPVFESPRLQQTRALREARIPVEIPDQEDDSKEDVPEDPAVNLEPTTSGKGKEVDVLTAGIHHVPTLQGNNPLTEEGPTGLMSEIEYREGNIPLEGTPAAAIFSTSAETSTPAQTNYTRTVTALPGRQWDSDTGAGGPVGVESGRVLYRS